jgi:hypothetical protein
MVDRTLTDSSDIEFTEPAADQVSAEIKDEAVTNAKLADMAQATIKGRASGAGTGAPVDLTATQARTILNVEDGATADQTAAEIRALGFFDTSNDGTGSGLDADLLDGNQASAFQPVDSDLTAIAALTTTAAGRSVLTIADAGVDRVIAWDDTAGAMAAIALADITDEGSPAAGDFLLIYGAEGDLRRVDWDDLPGAAGGISDIVEDTTPQLGGDLDLNGNVITAMVIGTDIQAFDELLNEIAGLSTDPNADSGLFFDDSAGNMAYWTPTLGLEFNDANLRMTANQRLATITFIIDGGGSAITTGIKGYLEIPFACTITAARALADQSGSIVVDVWKDTFANYPPTDADSITASAPVTITTDTDSEDETLTGWTTSVSAGDILGFNVDSVTTVERVTISLTVTKT